MKTNANKFFSVCILMLMVLTSIPYYVKAATVSPTYQFSEAYINGIYYQNLMSVNLTGNQRIDIVNVALSQFGYHEGGYSGDFSGESTGSNNYTEYQRMPGVTSGQGVAKDAGWCAAFVSWCARQAGIPTSIIRNSTTSSITNFNITKSTVPQAGNLMFVQTDSDVNIDHTALVYDVDDTYVYSIEGNKNNKVEKRKYYRNTGKQVGYETNYIEFYGDPNYEEKTVYAPTNVTTKVSGSNVSVSWDASENATYSDVYLVQEPWGWEDIKYSQVSYSTECVFENVSVGHYQAFVIARPNADTVQSNWSAFIVYDSVPYSTISANVTSAKIGDTVTFTYDIKDATYKALAICYDDVRYDTIVLEANSGQVSYTFTEARDYWCAIESSNTCGYNMCDSVNISIYDSVPSSTISANVTSAKIGDTVTFTYDIKDATYKALAICYDDVRYDTIVLEANSGQVSYTFTEEHNYWCAIEATNAYGYNMGECIYVSVDKEKMSDYVVNWINCTELNNSFYAEVEVQKNTDRDAVDTIMIAVYKDDVLIDKIYMRSKFAKGQSVVFGGYLKNVDGMMLKAFVWDSIEGMKTLSNVVTK